MILIENVKLIEDSNRPRYFTFWVKFILAHDKWISVSGWRYWPDGDRLSTPSTAKAQGKFFNTSKASADVYNQVKDQARLLLGGQVAA